MVSNFHVLRSNLNLDFSLIQSLTSLQALNAKLRMGGATTASYYSFEPHPRWRFVVLDGYDISMLGWPEGHAHHEQAKAILEKSNPNEARPSINF